VSGTTQLGGRALPGARANRLCSRPPQAGVGKLTTALIRLIVPRRSAFDRRSYSSLSISPRASSGSMGGRSPVLVMSASPIADRRIGSMRGLCDRFAHRVAVSADDGQTPDGRNRALLASVPTGCATSEFVLRCKSGSDGRRSLAVPRGAASLRQSPSSPGTALHAKIRRRGSWRRAGAAFSCEPTRAAARMHCRLAYEAARED
jgi:hypothetical protein